MYIKSLIFRLITLLLILLQQYLFADYSNSQLKKIEEKVNAVQNVSDYAISADAQYLLIKRNHPVRLELLSALDLSLIKTLKMPATITHNTKVDFIYNVDSRQSFIIGMGSINQLWEILYEDNPLPVYNGVMHDYRLGEGLVRDQSHFPIRIIKPSSNTSIPITSYFFHSIDGLLFIGRDKTIEVIQLDARQTISTLVLDEIPNLAMSKIKTINDTPHLFVPFLNSPNMTRINMRSWIASKLEGISK